MTGEAVDFPSSISAFEISSDEEGFSGNMKELRVWKEYRSAGMIIKYMHIDTRHKENLCGYWKMDESYGIVLTDYSSLDEDTDYSLFPFTREEVTSLYQPYWTLSKDPPLICSSESYYDCSSNSCTSISKKANSLT